MKTDTLTVPGATLYYEVRGSGPTLLLICGGIYDAAGFAGLADALADHFTVVTYDRRGNSRSPLDGPDEPQHVEVHADDAHRLLASLGPQPAFVFGNSSGAVIGLALAARHPEQVRRLVAHEPPAFEELPDRDRWRAMVAEIERVFAADGPGAAGHVLTTALEADGPAEPAHQPDTNPDPAMMARMGRNFRFFIGYEVPTFSRDVLDLAPLSTVDLRLAVGAESEPSRPYVRAARAIAEQVGAPIVTLPGAHGGFGTHAASFAEVLASTMAM
jgi:pimeloyl-ACP methyl ester carboxylesterase